MECIGYGTLWRGMERRSSECLAVRCGSAHPRSDDRRASHDWPGADSAAQLSRDGTCIAFTVLSESTRIWIYPSNAAAGRVLGNGKPVTPEQSVAENLVLSRDGRLLQYRLREIGSATSHMCVADVDDETVKTIVPERGTAVWPGCWSRDGRALVYVVWDYDQDGRGRSTVRLATRGGGDREIVPWSDDVVFQPMDWAPDGSEILGSYYNAPLTPGHPVSLALWPADGKAETAPPRILIQEPNLRIWQSSYSPDGRPSVMSTLPAGCNRSDLAALTGVGMESGPAQSSPLRHCGSATAATSPQVSPRHTRRRVRMPHGMVWSTSSA
jgi:hypothetical protein